MKQLEYLFDENISPIVIVIDYFRKKGFTCEAVKEIMEGEIDVRIGEYAYMNNKIIVTLDKDFGLIYSNIGVPVILLRLKNALPERIIFFLENFFDKNAGFDEKELPKIFVITEKKVRSR
ncbi:MAG: DUF5615 family PIN-like protein [Candidatus Aminicenantes bacterium]|nr:DUF5615 family PIN-like protein [Candidatus Aminicenantes bacterium]